jgi:hypothetical protein
MKDFIDKLTICRQFVNAQEPIFHGTRLIIARYLRFSEVVSSVQVSLLKNVTAQTFPEETLIPSDVTP